VIEAEHGCVLRAARGRCLMPRVDDLLLAQVFVTVTLEAQRGTGDAAALARRVLEEYDEQGVEALLHVVVAHTCRRLQEASDDRRPKAIQREVERRMESDPMAVLTDLERMIDDIRRDQHYGVPGDPADAAARLAEIAARRT
jgi:hypothetical protein